MCRIYDKRRGVALLSDMDAPAAYCGREGRGGTLRVEGARGRKGTEGRGDRGNKGRIVHKRIS